MTWFGAFLLVTVSVVITSPLRSEGLRSVPGEQGSSRAEVLIGCPGHERSLLVPVLWAMEDEDRQPSYEYRDRSRDDDMDRARKFGRSRDERGEDSQRSTIRGGARAHGGRYRSDPEESADARRSQQSSDEDEEGL